MPETIKVWFEFKYAVSVSILCFDLDLLDSVLHRIWVCSYDGLSKSKAVLMLPFHDVLIHGCSTIYALMHKFTYQESAWTTNNNYY